MTFKSLETSAELQNLDKITDFVRETVVADQKTKSEISVVCDEIVSNIVHYSSATLIKVNVFCDDEKISLEFRDNGKPFNPLDCQDPDLKTPLEDREIGGLGIFLVKKLMTTVSYSCKDKENILTLEKIIK